MRMESTPAAAPGPTASSKLGPRGLEVGDQEQRPRRLARELREMRWKDRAHSGSRAARAREASTSFNAAAAVQVVATPSSMPSSSRRDPRLITRWTDAVAQVLDDLKRGPGASSPVGTPAARSTYTQAPPIELAVRQIDPRQCAQRVCANHDEERDHRRSDSPVTDRLAPPCRPCEKPIGAVQRRRERVLLPGATVFHMGRTATRSRWL